MSETQKLTTERTIKAGYFDRKAFSQKEKLILVLKTGIAGLQFYVDSSSSEGQAVLEKLSAGTELYLYREPDNEYDQWAISVYTENDKHIGHVTRFKNEAIARMMDCGKRFFAFVDQADDQPEQVKSKDIRRTTENFSLPFSIYLEDR